MYFMVFLVIGLLWTNGFGYEIKLNTTELKRYDFLKIEVNAELKNAYMEVLINSSSIPDLLGRTKIFPSVRKERSTFVFIPRYGQKSGIYTTRIVEDDSIIFETNIIFLSRVQNSMYENLKILTFEENFDIRKLPSMIEERNQIMPLFLPKSNNRKFSYRETAEFINNLMDYLKMDTFLILGGQTTGFKKDGMVGNWNKTPIDNTVILKYLKEKGKKTGVYIMVYLVLGLDRLGIKDYKPTLIFVNSNIKKSDKFVSPLSERRKTDIIELVKYFGKKDYVDFIALDFVRFGDFGGYEIFGKMKEEITDFMGRDDFIFKDLRSFYLSSRKNRDLYKVFSWYLCRTVSLVVHDIVFEMRKEGINKPLFAFSLGWNAGREHGQDPFMFKDAGVDYSLYMLYEISDKGMFEMMRDYWLKNVYNDEVNILFGNIIDHHLNRDDQGTSLDEFKRRLLTSVDEFSYFPPKGYFFHDLYRLISGRLGNFSTDDWLKKLREVSEVLDFKYNYSNSYSISVGY